MVTTRRQQAALEKILNENQAANNQTSYVAKRKRSSSKRSSSKRKSLKTLNKSSFKKGSYQRLKDLLKMVERPKYNKMMDQNYNILPHKKVIKNIRNSLKKSKSKFPLREIYKRTPPKGTGTFANIDVSQIPKPVIKAIRKSQNKQKSYPRLITFVKRDKNGQPLGKPRLVNFSKDKSATRLKRIYSKGQVEKNKLKIARIIKSKRSGLTDNQIRFRAARIANLRNKRQVLPSNLEENLVNQYSGKERRQIERDIAKYKKNIPGISEKEARKLAETNIDNDRLSGFRE